MTDKWNKEESGWFTHPQFGGVCKESDGWYFYPIYKESGIGPWKTLTIAKQKAQEWGDPK
jgi:hypothetical protein